MEDKFQLAVIVCNYFPPCEFWLSSKLHYEARERKCRKINTMVST